MENKFILQILVLMVCYTARITLNVISKIEIKKYPETEMLDRKIVLFNQVIVTI